MRVALTLASVLVCACATPPKEARSPEASRPQVTRALYAQFDLAMERHAELSKSDDPAAEEERVDCARLAVDIAVRIASIDPDADVRRLVERVREAR